MHKLNMFHRIDVLIVFCRLALHTHVKVLGFTN